MTIPWFYCLIFYFFRLNLFFNSSCPILFWVLIEINLISFSLIILIDKNVLTKVDSLNFILYYFIVQSRASILFLRNFSFSDWGGIFNNEHIFLISLILKVGLFPLFFWVFTMGFNLGLMRVFLLLSFQKIPLFSALYSFNSPILETLLFLSFFVGRLILLFRERFLVICISSSISYTLILYFFFFISYKLFLGFFLLYRAFLGLALSVYFKGFSLSPHLLFWVFCFFLGLPPLGLFFFKLVLSEEFLLFFGPLELIIFWVGTIIGLVGYLKFFYYSFYRESFLYKIPSILSKNLVLIFRIFFSSIFLFFSL